MRINTILNWIGFFTGGEHTLGIKSTGVLWSWGRNTEGQLGDGTTTNKSSSTQIGGSTNWINIAAGSYHSLGIKTDGTLWAWGYNTFRTNWYRYKNR
ncbi:MAG: hypothetical protein IPK03_14420 [Bacteroidetes bacterium]|nr:hypothetical protein [Bacteroidota bacterium]